MAMAARSAAATATVARPQKCKVVVLGDAEVGKTSLVTRYVQGTFDEKYQATIGVDFLAKTLQLGDGRTMRLQLWDTAGQERFHSLAKSYVRDASAAVLVYDITKPASLDAARGWAECMKRECGDSIVVALVGNKADLADQREVSPDQGKNEARELGASVFVETSAKEGDNVDALFLQLAKALPSEPQPQKQLQQAQLVELPAAHGADAEEKKKRNCC